MTKLTVSSNFLTSRCQMYKKQDKKPVFDPKQMASGHLEFMSSISCKKFLGFSFKYFWVSKVSYCYMRLLFLSHYEKTSMIILEKRPFFSHFPADVWRLAPSIKRLGNHLNRFYWLFFSCFVLYACSRSRK